MTAHEQVLASMHKMAEKFAAAGVILTLPPPSNLTLGTRYIEVEMGKSLTAEIKFDIRFSNPLQMYQGGFLCAALDEVYGPLTYMTAEKPVVTIEMSTTFLRPFTAKDEVIHVKAEIVAKTKTLMVLRADVRTREGKLIATSSTHSMIVSDDNMKRG